MKCEVCKSTGFEPSVSGNGCTFCDGTEGGNPPIEGVDYAIQEED